MCQDMHSREKKTKKPYISVTEPRKVWFTDKTEKNTYENGQTL